MAFIVEMASPIPNRDVFLYFTCSSGTWDQTLDLARQWGWQPRGTSPDLVWKRQWDEYGKFTGDYECDEFGKVISADDAAALADALRMALKHPLPASVPGSVLLREGMSAKECRQASTGLGKPFLKQFIKFLRRGEFSFFWDD